MFIAVLWYYLIVKKVLAPVLAAGLSVSLLGCGESISTPESATMASAEVIDKYGCDVSTPDIAVTDLADESLAAFGDATIGQAQTTTEGIKLDDDLSEAVMTRHAIHETFHWCTDQGSSRTYQEAIALSGIGALTGSEGFAPKLNGSDVIDNTFIEEGVTEWLALGETDYGDGHPDYAGLARLTDLIASHRNVTRDDIASLHQSDDIVSFVAMAKNKPAQSVTGDDINDIFYLYVNAYETMPEAIDPAHIQQTLEQ